MSMHARHLAPVQARKVKLQNSELRGSTTRTALRATPFLVRGGRILLPRGGKSFVLTEVRTSKLNG
jgi:hypothetical protein